MILSDTEITALATEAAMITPFISALVRTRRDERRVLSYGLSSYGYDLRLSPREFYTFQPLREGNTDHHAIVDPKDFNPAHLTPTPLHNTPEGDSYFILPAHSYGLGVAVEHLALPADITALFIGKSTYARCFTGDTKVKLVDGDYSFLDLIKREENGEELWGYGVKEGKIGIQRLYAPRLIENSEVVEVVLDNNISIRCTGDHAFLMRDGTRKQAQNLLPDDSLHAIYDCHSHGYSAIYDPVYASTLPTKDRTASMQPVHRMVATKVYGSSGLHVHHKDGNRSNNHPNNLELMSAAEHAVLHNQEHQHHLRGGTRFAELYREDAGFRAHISARLHSEESKRKAAMNTRWWKESDENKLRLAEARNKRWAQLGAKEKQAAVMARIRTRQDVTEETVTQALLQTGTIRGAAKLLNVDRTAFRRMPHIIQSFKEGKLRANHKVREVRPVEGVHPTYCLTAETGNFALAAGVFVNNCGVIANTTPGEAGWHGHLTLEFSNSSSSPCRIYTNEGIVQALFFRGAPCATCYQTRAGKYQDQPERVITARI